MKHIEFKSFEEFFAYFELSKHCSVMLTSDETAYFEFQPYKGDDVIIRGWVEEFDNREVKVSFKYGEFNLGQAVWSIEKAKSIIQKVSYYSGDDED